MSDALILAEGLGKKYVIGHETRPSSETLRDAIARNTHKLFRAAGDMFHGRPVIEGDELEDVWALRDVSFEVNSGDVLGIIGRNGAGKSTLLKILSRITDPTLGSVSIRGRVASLLEVGTGFHSELTGRENIFLNGAILGMSRSEIRRKFDDIVDFAEMSRFLDTPVKRYSSGMYMRLAFAVAAHLDPEILIIDEVLAVGDAVFQRRCLGKMGEVARSGRTVLFVSHNIPAVSNLCTSVMWIDAGRVKEIGISGQVIDSYLKSGAASGDTENALSNRSHDSDAKIVGFRLFDSANRQTDVFCMGESLFVEFDVEVYRRLATLDIALGVTRTNMGLAVVHMMNHDSGFSPENISVGTHTYRVEIPNCTLYPAAYMFSLWLSTDGMSTRLDLVQDVASFSMVQGDITKRTQPLSAHTEAIFYIPAIWTEL